MSVDVRVPVAGGAEAEVAGAFSCAGTAPQQSLCTGTFVVPDRDVFSIKFTFSFTYFGTLEAKWQTATGETTVLCDMIFTGPPAPCSKVSDTGFYEAGQTATFTSVASGFGYWAVSGPH